MLRRKIVLIGLDCCDPRFLFDLWKDQLPVLSKMIDSGISGSLRSITPCITIPAWSCMFSGKDPGELGIYGFKNRKNYDYMANYIPYSTSVLSPRIWEDLERYECQSILVGIPQTFPVKTMKGHLVSGILTPSDEFEYTYPPELKFEIKKWLESEEYPFDIDNFRYITRSELMNRLDQMTKSQMLVFERLLNEKQWDFASLVLIGTDRINHGFWKYIDPEHPDYQQGNKYEKRVLSHYQMIDSKIGDIMKSVPPDTLFLIVSDHGAKRMHGGICVNQWLIEQGYLTLKPNLNLTENQVLKKEDIDWDQTKAWADGGYCGRFWFNVEGREGKGVIKREDYHDFRDKLKEQISDMVDHEGKPMQNRCYFPERIYKRVRRIAPDMIVYFGDLKWRAIGSIGHSSVFISKNDKGTDGANHSELGVFILHDPRHIRQRIRLEEIDILKVRDVIFQYLTNTGDDVSHLTLIN